MHSGWNAGSGIGLAVGSRRVSARDAAGGNGWSAGRPVAVEGIFDARRQ
jgi:hypothetical protein